MEEPLTPVTDGSRLALPLSIVAAALILSAAWVYLVRNPASSAAKTGAASGISLEEIAPSRGVSLPVTWGGLGARMVAAGVIDKKKLDSIYQARGGLAADEEALLTGKNNGRLVITPKNADFLLNLLWGLGLSEESDTLNNGPMKNPQYGGAGNFASTGGWVIAKENAMSYYSKYPFFTLTDEQKVLVAKVAANIHRPCCDNPTSFPDCNHGMAMLGFLELAASQGVSEKEMYRYALVLNSYWFPDNYLAIATYLKGKGVVWQSVSPQEILGRNFSSASAVSQIMSALAPQMTNGGGGCSV